MTLFHSCVWQLALINYTLCRIIILWAPTPQNGQTHSKNSSAVADELFECLTILWGLRKNPKFLTHIWPMLHHLHRNQSIDLFPRNWYSKNQFHSPKVSISSKIFRKKIKRQKRIQNNVKYLRWRPLRK